jgi:polyphosphate kinase
MNPDGDVKFLNRELSWIEFNRRVLSEAMRKDKPLLERLKFLAIVSSNFDEFFMVRVASLKTEYLSGNYTVCPSRMSPGQQLDAIRNEYREMIGLQTSCLRDDVLPALRERGFVFYGLDDLSDNQKTQLKQRFLNDYFPLLTPVRVSDEEPMVKAGNMRLHVGFLLRKSPEDKPVLSVVQLPSSVNRSIRLSSGDDGFHFTFLENLIILFASSLFPGYEILEHLCFRITRDADFAVDESRDGDFVEAMEEVLNGRMNSEAVRLNAGLSSERIAAMLRQNLGLREDEVFTAPEPLEISDFMDLVFTPGFDELRDEPWKPIDPLGDREDVDIWQWISARDRLLIHPFDSFDPVVRIVRDAAEDPSVLSIKMTLYRTSKNSPIVNALELAAQSGKQVTVLVEIKARFDEHRNIHWAERLEKAGVIVIYGIAELKVHAKALLIVRREEQGIRRYLHVSTGNYNDKTARLYTDVGMFTNRDDLCYEAGLFFNAITGYSAVPALKKLLMAPHSLKPRLIQLIDREIDKHSAVTPGHISAKINSLADVEVIESLYRASRAGVKIDLNIRGICMLKPGVPGLSENIRVVSIIDRYLEHPRIIRFHNGGNPEVYISSADWMGRNLDRRVELMTPVEEPKAVRELSEMLELYMRDNQQAYELQSDGSYRLVACKAGKAAVHAQYEMYRRSASKDRRGTEDSGDKVFNVRRRPPQAR